MKKTPHNSSSDDANGQNADPSLVEIAPPVPGVAYDLQVLQSLRRLMRATDIFSRRLIKLHKITGPQLISLHKLRESDGLTVSQLSKEVFLSPSTMVGILDRLEKQGWVARERSAVDRRKVSVSITEAGLALVNSAPSPLQNALQKGLAELPESEQMVVAESLRRLVEILELEDLDAAPLLEASDDLYQAP